MASVISVIPWESVHKDVDVDKEKWELYNIDDDFSQANDLSASNPQKLRELQDLWWAEAAKYNVLPMDWRVQERMNSELAGRPSLGGDAKTVTYYAGQVGLPPEGSPRILNKSWTVTADVQIPASGADGMIVTQGGLVGGYGLYVRDGKPTFVYNFLSLDRTTIAGTSRLPTGKVQIKIDFAYHGGPNELGKPATVTVTVNGAKVAEGQVPRTIPATISIDEGLDIGEDVGSAVDFTYKLPFKFTGTIDKVTFVLK
jgi:arylsulfatase